MQQAQTIIDQAWENRAALKPTAAPRELRDAIEFALAGLDGGSLRVAEKRGGAWITHQWLKKVVLLSFRLRDKARGYPFTCQSSKVRLGKTLLW